MYNPISQNLELAHRNMLVSTLTPRSRILTALVSNGTSFKYLEEKAIHMPSSNPVFAIFIKVTV